MGGPPPDWGSASRLGTMADSDPAAGLARPHVTTADAERVARELWGVEGEVTELGSQQDRNFLIEGAGRRYVLKFSNPAVEVPELEVQDAAAAAVATSGLAAPASIPALSGRTPEPVELAGATLLTRLLTWVDGKPLTGTGEFSSAAAWALGDLAARVASALARVEHPAAGRLTQWNLQLAGAVIEAALPHVPDSRRERVAAVARDAAAALAPLRDRLRVQTIHGDLSDDNIVGGFTGVIDFGDVARSWLVAELAVSCAAVLHHLPRQPLTVLETIAGFHARTPLTDDELAAVWPLVRLRTAVLVASGEQQVAFDGDNIYADENRRHEWTAFTVAEGLDATTVEQLVRWRVADAADAVPTGQALDASAATVLDLSTTSPLLDGGAWLAPGVEERLAGEALADAALVVAEWGVPRLTRTAPRAVDVATIPIGVEVWAASATPVRAPGSGTVRHAGGDVVLSGDGWELWLAGLTGIEAEGPVEAGTVLGTLARHPASLFMQLSHLPGGARPPRFSPPSQADVWKRVCPDPSALFGLVPAALPDTPAQLLVEREAAFARVQEHYYADPPRIERGWREYFVDTEGQTLLDMVNNVATVGHGHPRLVEAVARQWALQNTNSRFHYAAVAEFSARLAELAPDPLDTVFLVNSGSEAVDLAIRLATAATGRTTMIAMREAYHGWTIGSDAVSSSIGDNPRALETRPDWVRLIDPPHPLRGVDGAAALASLDAVLAAAPPPAGFIAEAVYGNAGGVLLPPGYLAEAYARVRAAGGLCIADEVQVGYGRLGAHFWGFEHQDAVPDIITVAKAMGNGHPLGAVITTRAIADAFATEGSMFSSAGGSPVSCVVGMTVLDILRDEALQENARVVGEVLRPGLLALAERHPLIAAVHGMGLYLGVELMRAGMPAPAEAAAICDALLLRGVIVQPTGDHKNVLKIKPPMVITRESAEFFLAELDAVLGEL
jgi:4-aminobutyrate aminotransferase-like enzyme/Ser/Thr protein kinase RdoA (MazF antagonist)